jgi:hypothetical protein
LELADPAVIKRLLGYDILIIQRAKQYC